jgi:hypothetical protein
MKFRAAATSALAATFGMALSAHAFLPPGWVEAGSTPAEYEFAEDSTMAASGKSSALIAAKAGARSDGFGTLMQTIAADDYRGGRWRLSGYLKTDGVNRAQMWMRVDGVDGKVLGFDNMGSRPVTGTTGWTRYEIELEVPPQSADIAFGFLLASSGKVWGDNFQLEKVAEKVPVTVSEQPFPQTTRNLDFEDSGLNETAFWASRKLMIYERNPPTVFPDGSPGGCEGYRQDIQSLLLDLGARSSDLDVQKYGCPARLGVSATFSALEPNDNNSPFLAGRLINAHWETINIKVEPAGETVEPCNGMKDIRDKVLPMFSTRQVEEIRARRGGASGLECTIRLQVLKPGQALENSP